MLQNLYLLHDPTFDEELRRASVFVTDRNALFNMVEAVHHSVGKKMKPPKPAAPTHNEAAPVAHNITKAALVASDYAAFMLTEGDSHDTVADNAPTTRQQQLIDDFISQSANGKANTPPAEQPKENNDTPAAEESKEQGGFFTETLARIYIQQGRYDKALQIIRQLNLNYPEKSRYFADQIRFLEKVIISQNQ